MNIITAKPKCMKTITLLLTLCFAGTGFAQVDVDTPDPVLLKGKNLEKMFKVAERSARLEFFVEGIDTPVKVTFSDSATILDTSGLTEEEKARVHDVYVKFSGNSNVHFADARSK